MDTPDITLRLAGPAKLDGKWRKPGDTVTVPADMLDQLPVDEVLDGDPQEVQSALARAVEAEAQRDLLQTRVLELQGQVTDLTASRDAARARSSEADAEVRSLQARNFELEKDLADLQGAAAPAVDEAAASKDEDIPPPSSAAKAPAKKGAGAKS